jgi:DNA/RNA-binding domain of Phe-tRNA-synthetase-like protein
MHEFTYRIDREVLQMFPGYRLGVLVYSGSDNAGSRTELTQLLRDTEESVRKGVVGNVTENVVVAAWREAYRRFGAKPAEYRSSIEALLRRVLKPDSIPGINPLVDIGTAVSLMHLVPTGVHPIRHEATAIELRLARSGDHFLPAAGQEPESVTPGEVVLADQCEVLTRRWTWRQSANTRMEPSTKRAFFNVDALGISSDTDLEAAMSDAQRLVAHFCGGTLVRSIVLSASNPGFSCSFD